MNSAEGGCASQGIHPTAYGKTGFTFDPIYARTFRARGRVTI
jgi:hypothetical protein